jgi:hypothetical protein
MFKLSADDDSKGGTCVKTAFVLVAVDPADVYALVIRFRVNVEKSVKLLL